MQSFSFVKASTIDEAIRLIANDGTRVVAGGTDLVVEIKKKAIDLQEIVDIGGLKELQMITVNENYLNVGACSTFSTLSSSNEVKKYANGLFEAANTIGSPQIRNLGTLGGNMANASVAADSIAPLMSLRSLVELESLDGKREVEAKKFFSQNKKDFLKSDEIITNIKIPLRADSYSTYVKLGKRKSLAIVVLGLAMNLIIDKSKICQRADIIVNAVSPLPVELSEIEECLIGKEFKENNWRRTLPLFQEAIIELIPNRASMPFKKEAIKGVAIESFRRIEKMIVMEDE